MPDSWFHNFTFDRLFLENCNAGGLDVSGSVFEGDFVRAFIRKCGPIGAHFHLTNSGNPSTLRWTGGSIRECGVGMKLETVNDLAIDKTYFLLNTGPGLQFDNGLRGLLNSGFENNQTAGSGPAIVGANYLVAFNVIGGGNFNTQSSLFDGFEQEGDMWLRAVRHNGWLGNIAKLGGGQVWWDACDRFTVAPATVCTPDVAAAWRAA